MQFKRTLYGLFRSKINFLTAYKNRLKPSMKLFYIEHRVHGYFLGAGTVLYIAGSLRYLRIKQPSINAHSLQFKRTLYALFPCKIKFSTAYKKRFTYSYSALHSRIAAIAWDKTSVFQREFYAI